MRSSSKLLSLFVTFLLSTQATALYFTVPTAGTVWTDAAGEAITWKFQAGDARLADLILETADKTSSVIVAKNLDLGLGTSTFPSAVKLASSSTGAYFLLLVDASNTTYIYSQVGPIIIQSIDSTASASATAATVAVVPISNPKTSVTAASTEAGVSTSVAATTSSTSTSTTSTTSSSTSTSMSSSSSSGDFVVTTFVTATPSSATLISGKASSSSTVKASGAARGREASRWTAGVLFAVGVSWVVL